MENVKKYRKKPVVIEAIQLLNTPKSILEVNQFIEGKEDIGHNNSFMAIQKFEEYCNNISDEGGILIKTLESKGDGHFASFGDYVIKGIKGEFYACKPDIFLLTYEANPLKTEQLKIMERKPIKHIIKKVGFINKKGEVLGFEFDGSKSTLAAINITDIGIQYGGYTIEELKSIAIEHKRIT